MFKLEPPTRKSKLPLSTSLFLLLLRLIPICSNPTHQVSSLALHAELFLITLLLQSAMVRTLLLDHISLLEIHGEPGGVTKVTSRLANLPLVLLLEFVVLTHMFSIQTPELYD